MYNQWHFVVLTVTSKPFLMNAFGYFYVQMLIDDIPSPANVTDMMTYDITNVMINSTSM